VAIIRDFYPNTPSNCNWSPPAPSRANARHHSQDLREVEDLPEERLMAIARHPLLSKAAHGPLLPPSWRTLYDRKGVGLIMLGGTPSSAPRSPRTMFMNL